MKAVMLFTSLGTGSASVFDGLACVILDQISFVQNSGGKEKKWGNPTCYNVG